MNVGSNGGATAAIALISISTPLSELRSDEWNFTQHSALCG